MPTDVSPVGKGYALWLMPEEPAFSLLAGEISRLSQECSTPRFDPHVTLLGGITVAEAEALASTVPLAESLKPFGLELGEIGYLEDYFRCLFVRVIPTDSLINANQTAREVFRLPNEPPYMPHLSLVYGKLQMEKKKVIAARCGFLSGRALEIRHLTLFRVTGTPDEWKCVEKFRLSL